MKCNKHIFSIQIVDVDKNTLAGLHTVAKIS
jgi:hypothetical protein